MRNHLFVDAPSLAKSQAGNSTVGYLLLATLVGVAGVVSLSAFGTASELAIAGKAAGAATETPLVGGNSAAGMIIMGDEAEGGSPPELSVPPSELDETVESAQNPASGGADQPIGFVDENNTIFMGDGQVIGAIQTDGSILNSDGTEIGTVQDGKA